MCVLCGNCLKLKNKDFKNLGHYGNNGHFFWSTLSLIMSTSVTSRPDYIFNVDELSCWYRIIIGTHKFLM